MAIYHLSVKPVSRGGGRSATAASAYRAAELVYDHTTDQTFDYTRKRGVEHSEIVLSTRAAEQDINWARDRQQLWNAAEEAERRKDSRVAREYEVALPHELTKEERIELVRDFATELANRYNVAVDFALHEPHWEGDERNYHAHLLTTTREIEPDGLGAKTDIELGDRDRGKKGLGPAKEEILEIRERWAQLTNEHLQEQGLEIRIDHRSLSAQGIERQPTQHLGVAVSGMERRGIETEAMERIRGQALAAAQERVERSQELKQLEREGVEIESSILDLSGDLAAAIRERDQRVEKSIELTPDFGADQSIEQRLRAAVEERAEGFGIEWEGNRRGEAPEHGLERGRPIRPPGPERELSADERLRAAVEQGHEVPVGERERTRQLELERTRSLELVQVQTRDREKERELERRREREIEGPELEL
jgi:hypothetical protein